MPSLGTIYRYYANHIGEYKQLIQRERALIDPSAIVSVDEFLGVLMPQTIERKQRFSKRLGPVRSGLERTLYYWAGHEDVPSYDLLPKMVTEDQLELMEERRIQREKQREELAAQYARLPQWLVQKVDDPFEHVCCSGIECISYPAFDVDTIMDAFDVSTTEDEFLLSIEEECIWRGDGKGVLDFWKGVNALKDYSGFFPDKHFIDGDRKKDDKREFDWGKLIPGGLRPQNV